MKLWLDLETYSEVPITHGTHRYAAGAEILLFAWAVDDAPAQVWDCTLNTNGVVRVPEILYDALEDPAVEIWAHNSHFDRTVLRHAKSCRVAAPAASEPHRWRDTMVQALAHSLPGSLGDLCAVLGLEQDKSKDKDGRRLVHLFCKPQPTGRKLARATRLTHPADWERFVEYARLDVEAMREVHKRLPTWNYGAQSAAGQRELALWHLDQQINDRGVCIDLDLARGALAAVDCAQQDLARQTKRMTGGAVETATQRDAMLDFIAAEHGVLLEDLRGATVDKLLAGDLDPGLRELLLVRQQASTTSTAKYKTLANATSSDGRLRGTLQFCGAARTGRWAGRLFQPQNIPRGVVHGAALEAGIEAMRTGCAELIY